jgi:ABC-type transporter MlaC component
MRYLLAGVMAWTLLACACSKKPSAEEQAVREAISAHLNQQRGLALNKMKLKFESVTIQGDTAKARVRFQSVARPELAVAMDYALRRVDGKWQVESNSPVAGMGPDSHQESETPEGNSAAAPPASAAPSTTKPKPQPSH